MAATQTQKPSKKALFKAFTHPLRVRAYRLLAEKAYSPSEIAVILNEDLHSTSYHVRALEKFGLVEVVEEKQVRGAIQHFFRSIERPVLSTEEWKKLTPEEREPITRDTLQLIIGDALLSEESGVLDQREDRHLSRVPMVIDETGWSELHDLHLEMMNRVIEVQAASAERLTRSSDPQSFSVMSAAICIEMPEGREKA